MPTDFKRVVIACLFAFPSLVFAADAVVETPSSAPQQCSDTAVAPPPSPPRIGYVDIARIGTESERGTALKTLLTARKEALQSKITGKKKSIEKLKASIEAKVASMTPQQREAKSKEFQKKVEELQKFAQESEVEFFSLQDKETKALYEAVERIAVAHGKANSFAAIVIKKELLYVSNAVNAQDVTDDLIRALNQETAKK